MLRLLSIFFLIMIFPVLSFAQENNSIPHVIYITLDGVRWQDVFNQNDLIFEKLWKKYQKQGHFYGAHNSKTKMEVASIPISLPSYQSQLAGAVQPCDGNDCGRIQAETMAEAILHRLQLKKKDVAIFSSWPTIAFASEQTPGTVYTNTGNFPVYDPETGIADAMMADINKKQKIDHPHGADRFDRYTIAQALHYFESYQPRFLWISLDDADEQAHDANLPGYREALKLYDDFLDKLFTLLITMKLDKKTVVIVTTDHGRGNGGNWIHHGPKYPESKQTWAYVWNGDLKALAHKGEEDYYSTLSIRPTVESLFGLS